MSAEIPELEGRAWCVAVVKPLPQQRAIAVKALQSRGYAVLLPMCREMRLRANRVQPTEEPMFGRYVFVGVAPGQNSWDIRWVPGVQHLTLDGKRRPITVAVPVLAAIVARMRADGGIVNLCPKPKAVGAEVFVAGQPVRVTSGPFEGWEGLFQADQGERCRVLLRLFGRAESVVQIPASSLVSA